MKYIVIYGILISCSTIKSWNKVNNYENRIYVNETGSDYFYFTSNVNGVHVILPHMGVGDTTSTLFTYQARRNQLSILVKHIENDVDTFLLKYDSKGDYLLDYDAPAAYRRRYR